MRFVCRWREDSPYGKRVVEVPDAGVLEWFRRGWGRDEPDVWIENELGGDVYGLDSIFDEARKLNLPAPRSIGELRALLHQHLYVEADDPEDYIRLGEHALRVRTDDDEVDLAYYFIDDTAAAAAPERLTYLLHDTWPLPTDAAPEGTVFDNDVPVRTLRLGSDGTESVFSVRLAWASPDMDRNLGLVGAVEITGLGLARIGAGLRNIDAALVDGLPHDVRLLRALTATGEDDPGPAMRRYARLPGYRPTIGDTGPGTEQDARSLTHVDEHIVQVARYIDDFFGFDQWFVFDSRWAAAHSDLARSLLRYASHWDPFGPRQVQ
ncbi:hypothetical protein [Actinoplanes couchii]|uniref:Uncharacterized protein n=1 Tax=Actinoplanes couchii TaxID=403638 RepID=A0ABQ3XKY7_9ACTN|nr:hypothetical protein [Actinoplanes couchii]MDR6319445.1 hypothetical protein [Actinoplanes couchii]GID59164.1 hypothetical protein Aco03nite_075680 [Actinoplanes couchii]